jgi:hypothetical protein
MAAPWLVDLEERLAASTEDDETDVLATTLVVLAAVAGANVPVDEDERRGATRRALLRLAAGGDPSRGLDLNGPAVSGLAEELRDIDRQIALETGFRELAAQSAGLPHVSEALHGVMHAPDIGWRAYACSLLAEDLGAE